ncbi:glycoside hydrolase family 2 TIM barrel-domain containing protein [Pedobacter gandavensis]|uniref:glycoside hydrolase family 2 TIM barrel-domain containing protein n=1 Tax=Pedobacter gandavensis TaxID=2679963 RepID=UPI00247933DE|nr:glycoside hydrolase family 2 TIM barrel-domain containing protein [Pedobacter gandavensis]WGQ11337.1 glycoside hydrolase family 2 TIM barrel-domain containing protein [Pedobacter gandavensis]
MNTLNFNHKLTAVFVFLLWMQTQAQGQSRLSPLPEKTSPNIIQNHTENSSSNVLKKQDRGSQPIISLDGNWEFKQGNKRSSIAVPGEWGMQGFEVSPGESVTYSKKINIPADWQGMRVKIRFDGVSSHAVLRINQQKIAEHEGSFVPFEADLSSQLKPGENILELEVSALTISDILACTSQYAAHTVGGILRKVTLFALPQMNIADLRIETDFDPQYKNALLKINAKIVNEAAIATADAFSLRYTLTDQKGKTVFQKTTALNAPAPGKDLLSKQEFKVLQPQHWNSDVPYLYRLHTELLRDGKTIQKNLQRVGFREIAIRGNELLLNGKPVKLRGVNRHSVHPLTGRSISKDLEYQDAKLFMEANCNFIRTAHYPPSEEFLEACDELGLFVENESSLTWINHHASPIWKIWNYKDEKFLPVMMNANLEKMQAAINHPSVIIWSLGNESNWSPLWQKVQDAVKAFDPSRPTAFHDQCWGGFNNLGSKADIANYHYPAVNGPAATDTMSRPTLFGEYAHLSTYNRRELLTDPGLRSAYQLPLVSMYDSVYQHKGNLGAAVWSGIDDTFHLPDGRIVGYGPWGMLDGWRRPKPEYWGMRKAYAPILVKNPRSPKIKNGNLTLSIENRYDFIRLNQVEIIALVDGKRVKISGDLAPRSQGEIKIPVQANTKEVYISFKDPRGFVLNEERILIAQQEVPNLLAASDLNELKSMPDLKMHENEAAYRIQHGSLTFLLNKTTGILTSVENNGKKVLKQGPVFCYVPINSEDGGKPNVAGETYQNDIFPVKNYPLYTLFVKELLVKSTDSGLVFTMHTTYTNATGKIRYLFRKDGKVQLDYEIQMDKSVKTGPYQYGMLFQLPSSYETLKWKRKGDFTVYDEQDVSRNEGTASLNAKWFPGVEAFGKAPSGAWKDDANEMGSNDFRATKAHILQAELLDKTGNGLQVNSNAKQSSRAWLQDGSIQFLVADYSNGGSEPFYASPFDQGRIDGTSTKLKGSLQFELK